MTVGRAMSDAAIRLLGRRPQSFFGAPGTFEQELCDLVNEVARDIVRRQDWQALVRVHTITADGVSEQYPFPTDYSRQLVNTWLQDPDNWAWGYEHITDINQYILRKNTGFEPFPGGWTIFNDAFHFTPAPHAGAAAQFPYITKNYGKDANGTPIAQFSSDQDTFVLDDDLLTLGIIWRWRENKKLDYTGDEERFFEALAEIGTKDGGSRIIRRGRRLPGRFVTAYPWTLGSV